MIRIHILKSFATLFTFKNAHRVLHFQRISSALDKHLGEEDFFPMNKRVTPSSTNKAPHSLLRGQFKSPLSHQSREIKKQSPYLETETKLDIEKLQKKIQDADSQIKLLEDRGLKESELSIHINKLHEYNEIKDIGQMVLGRIALLEGVQTKDLYQKYDLDLKD